MCLIWKQTKSYILNIRVETSCHFNREWRNLNLVFASNLHSLTKLFNVLQKDIKCLLTTSVTWPKFLAIIHPVSLCNITMFARAKCLGLKFWQQQPINVPQMLFSVHCQKVLSWLGHKICNMRLATLIKIAMKVLLSHSRRHGLKLVIFFAVIHTEFVRLINHFFVRRKPHLYTEWLTDILNQGSVY